MAMKIALGLVVYLSVAVCIQAGPRWPYPLPRVVVPAAPGTPGTPYTPQTPGTPGTPQTPGTPYTPQTPPTPKTPKTPSAPQPPSYRRYYKPAPKTYTPWVPPVSTYVKKYVPTKPSYRPHVPQKPHYKPSVPHYKPSVPHYKPSVPHYKPSVPHYKPSVPHYKPSVPHYKPSVPHYKPSAPHYKPSVPHYKPSVPHYKPSVPHYKPSVPHYKPSVPHYKPYVPPKPTCKVYYTNWGPWGPCSVSCGTGYQSRRRYCAIKKHYCTPPKYYNCKIYGPSYDKRSCYTKPCCPDVDGKWSYWGCWSECVNGERQRQRACDWPRPQGFGKPCNGSSVETECCTGAVDLVFSIDKSGSISSGILTAIINVLQNIIDRLPLDDGVGSGAGEIRVGVQTFNHDQQIISQLNDFTTNIGTQSPGGGTDIAAALAQIGSVMYTPANGDRMNPPHANTVVLLTDGFTSPAPVKPANVDRLIVIGLGASVASTLPDLASSPDDYLQVTDACDILGFLEKRILCQEAVTIPANSSLCMGLTSRVLINATTTMNGTAPNITTNFVSM